MKEPHILKKPTKSTFEISQDKMVTALVEQSTNLTQISASGIFTLKCLIKQLRVLIFRKIRNVLSIFFKSFVFPKDFAFWSILSPYLF